MSHFVNLRMVMAFAGAASLWTFAATATAGVVVGGWNYAIDSQNDGSGSANGFEYRGLAFKEVGGIDYFAISSGMPLHGITNGGALNGNVGHGDLFINFSAHNLDSAAKFTDAKVFGVRFDSTNDSLNNIGGSNTTIGLFKNITATSLTTQNLGYSTLQQYYNAGFGRPVGAMGDLSSTTDVTNYFGNGVMYPSIKSGTKVGDITLLTRTDLNGLGLNFGQFNADPSGNNVFGFSVSAGLLPEGSFTADVFFECINDGVALKGANAPEPGSLALLGIGAASLCTWARIRRTRGTPSVAS